ncbi:MAG: class I SAM-dependent methyltransferase [Chloroflexota bacterium]
MNKRSFSEVLWRIYNRPDRPLPFAYGGNLPWDNPEFSARMLREHLTQEHGAASRKSEEILLQTDWLWRNIGLTVGNHLLDVTCGPGLYAAEFAQRGLRVTGTDFGPAAVAYARQLAIDKGVDSQVEVVETDVRTWHYPAGVYDHAIMLYGQLAVMTKDEAQTVLEGICNSLKPDGCLVIELLNQERVDKKDSTWWYTDEKRLWGDAPFMLLGERKWYAEDQISLERYYTIHLETGELEEVVLCDQTYSSSEMDKMLTKAGFSHVKIFEKWDNLPLYDADEWTVYIAKK